MGKAARPFKLIYFKLWKKWNFCKEWFWSLYICYFQLHFKWGSGHYWLNCTPRVQNILRVLRIFHGEHETFSSGHLLKPISETKNIFKTVCPVSHKLFVEILQIHFLLLVYIIFPFINVTRVCVISAIKHLPELIKSLFH